MDFSQALIFCKSGSKIARSGWNGKDMYVVYQKGYPDGVNINKNTAEATGIPEGTLCRFLPYLIIKIVSPEPTFVPWVISQADVLAKDWIVL